MVLCFGNFPFDFAFQCSSTCRIEKDDKTEKESWKRYLRTCLQFSFITQVCVVFRKCCKLNVKLTNIHHETVHRCIVDCCCKFETFSIKCNQKIIFFSTFQRLQLNTSWRRVKTWLRLERSALLNWVSQHPWSPNIRKKSSHQKVSLLATFAAFSHVSVSSMTPLASSQKIIWLNSERETVFVVASLDASTTLELTLACGLTAHSLASPRTDSCQKDIKPLAIKPFRFSSQMPHTIFFVFSLFYNKKSSH